MVIVYRGPPARIRIFRDCNFSADRPITHALCIQNAFLYIVLSCVSSHKTEVLISVRASKIVHREKKQIQTQRVETRPLDVKRLT